MLLCIYLFLDLFTCLPLSFIASINAAAADVFFFQCCTRATLYWLMIYRYCTYNFIHFVMSELCLYNIQSSHIAPCVGSTYTSACIVSIKSTFFIRSFLLLYKLSDSMISTNNIFRACQLHAGKYFRGRAEYFCYASRI